MLPLKSTLDGEKWRRIVREGAAEFNLPLSDIQLEGFYLHMMALLEWSNKINLTSISDPHAMAIKHFVDSVVAIRYCMPMSSVLDMGSGAGFPGLPIKICCPDIQLTMVDAVRKKVSFLKHVIRLTGLKGAQALHKRLEDIKGDQSFAKAFDTIVCRAFGDLKYIVEKGLPLLMDGGKIVVWKGRVPENELKTLSTPLINELGGLTIRVESYRLPILDAHRTIIILSPRRETSNV
jgi:16S rRNA (guanine527-N7)-methyltransferase